MGKYFKRVRWSPFLFFSCEFSLVNFSDIRKMSALFSDVHAVSDQSALRDLETIIGDGNIDELLVRTQEHRTNLNACRHACCQILDDIACCQACTNNIFNDKNVFIGYFQIKIFCNSDDACLICALGYVPMLIKSSWTGIVRCRVRSDMK